MMSLFDEEEILRSYIRSERYEAAQEAAQSKVKEKAKLMLEKGKVSMEELPAFFPELSEEEIREIKKEMGDTTEK